MCGNGKASLEEKMKECLSFYNLYLGKVEIAVLGKENKELIKTETLYFPILPVASFLRSSHKDTYMENIECVPAILRMKDLLVDTGSSLSSKMHAGYTIHNKINYPLVSEIFRWERLWLVLLILLTIAMNYLVAYTYSSRESIDKVAGQGSGGNNNKLI